jgi:dihydrofolate reductase
MITAIMCQSQDGWIADENGRLPWKAKGALTEMRFFQETTRDSLIIVGRTTYLGLQKSGFDFRARFMTLILSGSLCRNELPAGVEVAEDPMEAFKISKMAPKPTYVIGGPETWKSMSPYTDRLLISTVPDLFHEADKMEWRAAPKLGDFDEWANKLQNGKISFVRTGKINVRSGSKSSGDIAFTVSEYAKTPVSSSFSAYSRWVNSFEAGRIDRPQIENVGNFNLKDF